MGHWKNLVSRVTAYNPNADTALLKRAYDLVKVKGGRPPPLEPPPPPDLAYRVAYAPLEVARILVELRLDIPSVIAGLLYEHVGAERLPLEDARKSFGEDVAFILGGLTRISLVTSHSKNEDQSEDFRKLLLAMAKDIRVVLVRLAICLQQMRGLVGTQVRIPEVAREILDIYAPIAHRLGIHWIKSELEDLAFCLEDPEEYHRLRKEVLSRRQGGRDVVKKVTAHLEGMLARHGISGRVMGREKHLYSIREKLERKNISIEELFDLIAYRIIVESKADCYRALGMIHSELTPLPGHFKDYVALPKINGYQSLHTIVIGPFGNRIEIQLRSEEMHRVAEAGVAAHWVYKGRGLEQKKAAGKTGYAWLKQLLLIHRQAEDPEQFLENVKVDLFPDEIYVFTPRGDIITLPVGATPVDFAYEVHSQVGDACQGARINGRIMPLKTPLLSGDMVEVLTAKNRHPNVHWLDFVVTSKARYHITRWDKRTRRDQMVALGRELLEREVRKLGEHLRLTEKMLEEVAAGHGLSEADELLFQVGSTALLPHKVVEQVFSEEVRAEAGRRKQELEAEALKRRRGRATGNRGGLRLSGELSDMAAHVAGCCSPVPGEPVVGIITTGKGITVHRANCTNLVNYEKERWIEDVEWGGERGSGFASRLRIMVENQKGVWVQVSQAMSEVGASITEMNTQDRDRDPCILLVGVEVEALDHLERVMSAVQRLPVVHSVERLKG